MKRRDFLQSLSISAGAIMITPKGPLSATGSSRNPNVSEEMKADLIIAGAGMGGCAAAMAALRNGLRVIMTEETDWIGGQLTQQGLSCPDEHQWIESFGATFAYRDFRTAIREYYRRYYPLTSSAKANLNLNPGNGSVSRLCFEPRIALAILNNILLPYLSSGKLVLLLNHKVIDADTDRDQVKSLKVSSSISDREIVLHGAYFIDATELGDLLPLTKTEYVTGAESRKETRELHAQESANPADNQAFTYCFAMDYLPGENHVIEKPEKFSHWSGLIPELIPAWPGKLFSLVYSNPATLQPRELGLDPSGKSTGQTLNLFNYRRIIDKNNFAAGFYKGDITIVNWPQNDYFLHNLIDVNKTDFSRFLEEGKQLSLSLLYWLQTEVPRPDGKQGWPGLRLRKDVMGTADGLAKYPYIRESRRIKAVFTILEEHVGKENRKMVAGEREGNRAAEFFDSIGIGSYHIDLHPGTGGNNYIDFPSLPFQIPLGALLPQRMRNLIPANKNIGTTHITNGCYRLHPVEWSIGESSGLLVAYAIANKLTPHSIRGNKRALLDFQRYLQSQGIDIHWPKEVIGK